MSWQKPVPPVLEFWKGMTIIVLTILITGALGYLLLA